MIRSGYSFKTAIGHLESIATKLERFGWQAAPLADRYSTFSFVRWRKVCAKHNLRPIYGVELAVSPDPDEKKPAIDYWTFLAKDDITALHRIIALATKAKALTYQQAVNAAGLVKITGNRAQLVDLPWADDLYVGLMPSTPRGLYRYAVRSGLKFLARSDNVYCDIEDRELYRLTLSQPAMPNGRARSADVQTYPQHLLTDEEWIAACTFAEQDDIDQALHNRNHVLGQCHADLNVATLLVPEKLKSLRAMCEEGAVRHSCNLGDPVYGARLDRELAMIEEKKFEDYFYIIADVVAFAKERMIVGPARGSSCGSLVCYLLGITTIDPIPQDLIFERFIDINRNDLPDIDIDFSDARREQVFQYIEERYGKEHVARLGTVAMFQPRSALKQIANNLDVMPWRVEKVLDGVIQRSSGDTRANQQLEDTLRTTPEGKALLAEVPELIIAARLENHPHTASQHAAGVVITDAPIDQYVAIDSRTGAAWCDKKDAEELNLLKIDALGLTQLSIFERTLELSGLMQPARNGFLERLPMDDQAAYDVLNKGKFSGVFQFNGIALQNLTKSFRVDKFDDLVHITALARPGPLGSGAVGEYVKRRTGVEPVHYPHSLFEPYIKDTLGVVMYQEQVMQIGRGVGDLTWEDVTALRKAMSKSLGKEFFDQYGNRWKDAAERKGVPRMVLEKVWDDLCAYGNWSFNKSHAVAYATVSYYCLWLKAHYPVEFAAATLDAESDVLKQIQILRELHAEGIGFKAVDPDYSTDRWAIGEEDGMKLLVGPLTSIKGIGPVYVQEILTHRREHADDPLCTTELPKHIQNKLANPDTELKSIFPVTDLVEALDFKAFNITTPHTFINQVQCGRQGEVLIIGVLRKMNLRDENEDINVQKRGGRRYEDGLTWSLNMFLRDDTDEIFCKIDRFMYDAIGKAVMEHGKIGKAIYAIKGTVPPDFRMVQVKNIRYICDLGKGWRNEGSTSARQNLDNDNLGIPERNHEHDSGGTEDSGDLNANPFTPTALDQHIARQENLQARSRRSRSNTRQSAQP